VEVAHHLRFARALALASTTLAPGCYLAHERAIDVGPIDAYVADVPDAGPCAVPCRCPRLGDDGTCTGAQVICCPIVGPLSPPDLA
jgi:hypothetical protein